MSDSDALISRFEDVALQRYLMRPRVADRRLTDDGWILRHAVDVNVLASYIHPHVHSKSDRGAGQHGPLIGYGEVFRKDDPDRMVQIAAAALYHVWHGLQTDAPLLIVPPLQGEFHSNIRYFLDEYSAATPVDDSLDELARKIQGRDYRLEQADMEKLRKIVVENNTRTGVLRRLHQIFQRDRIRLAHGQLDSKHFDAMFRDALRPEDGDLARSVDLVVLKSVWLKRLVEIGRPQSAAASRDAETMARIELWNRELRRGKRRIIYITGDSSLLAAGERYVVEEIEGRSFTASFLRHPRAYLDEPGVLNPHPASAMAGTSLASWMDLLIGQFDDDLVYGAIPPPERGHVKLPGKMKDALRQLADQENDGTKPVRIVEADSYGSNTPMMQMRDLETSLRGIFARGIDQQWESYEATALKDTPEAAFYFLERRLEKLTDDNIVKEQTPKELLREALNEIRETLRREIDGAWEAFFATSKAGRFLIEVSMGNSRPAREGPRPCFQGRPHLLKFVEEADGWLSGKGQFSKDEYRELLTKVRDEDNSGYSDYLGHAHLLALQGHWSSAAILCLRAKERCDPEVSSADGSNGREANFLEAFYRRLSATKGSQLIGLSDLIDKAEKIFESEKRILRSQGEDLQAWPHDPVPERFTSERHALRITEFLFEWDATNDKSKKIEILWNLSSLTPDIISHHEIIQGRLQSLSSNDGPLPLPAYVTPPSFRREILEQLKRRALRNILGIGLLEPSQERAARDAWLSLKEGDEEKLSVYSAFLWLCGAAKFSDNTREREIHRRNLNQKFSNENYLNSLYVFPYDKNRISALRESAMSELRR